MDTNTIEYTPAGEPLSQLDNLKFILIFDAILTLGHFIPGRHGPMSWMTTIFIILGFNLLFIFTITNEVRITLTKATGTLQYDYLNFFGREKAKIVNLATAYYEYKPYTTKSSRGMRLLIYNNYFKNKIDIKVNDKRGFTEEQLDALVEEIKKIRGEEA